MDKEKLIAADIYTDGKKINELRSPSKEELDNTNMKRRVIQNFLLIWLDSSIEKSDDDYYESFVILRHVVNTINRFTDVDQCIDFLSDIEEEQVFIIVSGDYVQYIIPLIHDVLQLNSIYVLCENTSVHEPWVTDWWKVKGAFTGIDAICESLKQVSQQCDQNSISVSLISESDVANENHDQLDQSFMYTQILKEILFEIKYSEESIEDLAAYCYEQYMDNEHVLNKIGEFERGYHDKSPIWWYTYANFLYSMLNRALRIQEVDIIIKMGFFIYDLHRHIEKLYSEQFNDNQAPFTVYRGQGLSKANFEKLIKTKGGLISFNSFLSTSQDRVVSFAFAESNQSNPDFVGILFEINIDPTVSSSPFALISSVSHYIDEEKEILFSMHTVFRIGEIKQLDDTNQLWQVKLTLTSDNDQLLNALTQQIREETVGSTGWHRLGELLVTLGEFHKAEQVFMALLDRAVDDVQKRPLYHHLGRIKCNVGNYAESLSFYKKSLEIKQRTLPSNHPDFASSYNNIGSVYVKMSEYSEALFFYEKAAEILQNTFHSDHSDLSSTYNNIGGVYDSMGLYSKALLHYEKALEIRQKTLPSNHYLLAASYNNIGLTYFNMSDYSKALSFYKKSLEIRERTLPPNHPDLTTSYDSIGWMYANMCEYPKAVLAYEKALAIREKTPYSNNPDLGNSYNNIGSLYDKIGEYSKAILFYEKSLQTFEKTFPRNHPHFADLYNNIGLVYYNIGEYPKALSFYENGLELFRKTLPSTHPSLAKSYVNIGLVYIKTNEHSKALSLLEKALEILQRTLPPNLSDLAICYRSIGVVYSDMGNYSKALLFHQKALELNQKLLPSNHSDLAGSYHNIGLAYYHMCEYSKALAYYEKALGIFEKTLPSNHPYLAGSYNNIGNVHYSLGEYTKTLIYYTKAVKILEKTFPPNHPDLGLAYNNIGLVYENMNEYSSARSFYERAVRIGQCSLPANHSDLQQWLLNLKDVMKKL